MEVYMKKKAFLFLLIAFLIVGCQPSQTSVQTAVAETQISAPSNTPTLTPTVIPTLTPKPTFTPPPSPTPDLRVIKTDSEKLILTTLDLPKDAEYYVPKIISYFSYPDRNSNVIQRMGSEVGKNFIEETGRVDGWYVTYDRGNGAGKYPEEILDHITVFQRASGAELYITKYIESFIYEGYTPVEGAPVIGDMSRTYTYKKDTQIGYLIVFSYKNVVHDLAEFGVESEVRPDFIENLADILLTKLRDEPLSLP